MLQKKRRVQQACKDIRDGELEEDLARQELRPDDIAQLCDEVAKSRRLQKLSLFDNMLGSKGMVLVSDMLRANISLVDIELSANNIGDEGAAVICAALKSNRMLIRVGLGGNGIGNAGAKHMADTLMVNNHLQVLDFQFNKIGAEGCKHISEALRVNTGLLELFLGGNAIGDDGAEWLAAALRVNVHLVKLELSQSGLGESGAKELLDALTYNESVQALTLEDDGVSKETLREIRDRVAAVKAQAEDFALNGIAALQRNDKTRWGRAKLTVLGDAGSGKSALVRALLGQPPEISEAERVELRRRESAISQAGGGEGGGVEVGHAGKSTMRVELQQARDWQLLRTGVSDLCEQLAKHQFRPQSLSRRVNQATIGRASGSRSAAAVRKSARTAQQKSMQRSLRRGKSTRLRKALGVGRRAQAVLRIEEHELSERYSSTLKTRVESKGVSVDAEVTFTVWDFQGGELVRNLHHLFLTQFGAFVVCFDMERMLEDLDAGVASLRFWLDSVKLHAPSADVVIVGTRGDVVSKRADVNKISDALMTKLPLAAYRSVPNRGQRLRFFPVGAVDDGARDSPEVEAIRDAVSESVRGKAFVTRAVPLRWMFLLDLLHGDGNASFLPLSAVRNLALDRAGISETELENDLLPLMHELGILVNWSGTPAMASRVVMRPQWLLDELSRAVCEPEQVGVHREDIYFAEGFPNELEPALDRWRDKGVATRPLLDWLWRDADFAAPPQPPSLADKDGGDGSEAGGSETQSMATSMVAGGASFEAAEFFAAVLEQSLVGSPWPGEPGAMLLPALLPPAAPEDLEALAIDFAGGPLGYVQMDFLPRGAFQRLALATTSLVEGVKASVHKVAADFAILNLGGTELLLQPDEVERRVLLRFSRADGENGAAGERVQQLLEAMPAVATALRCGGRLQPRLLLCGSDGGSTRAGSGSIREDVSALASKVLECKAKRQPVQSVTERAVPFEAFALFFPRM